MISNKLLLIAPAFLWMTATLHAASDVSILGGANKGGKYSGANPKVFRAKKPKATAGVATIKKTLNAGKGVVIRTESPSTGEGNLMVGVPIIRAAGKKPATLTFDAVNDIKVNAAITSRKSTVAVNFKAEGSIETSAIITTNGGNVSVETLEALTIGAALDAGSGTISVQSGALQSNSAQTVTAAAVQVAPQGTWKQAGTLKGSLTVQGTVGAGANSTSSLQVNGPVALQTGSILAVNLGGTNRGTNYGSIVSSGAVTLDGTTLQVDCANGFEDLIVPNQSFTVLAGESITGTFEGLPDGSRVALPDELGTLKVTYTGTTVTLSEWEPIFIDQMWDPGLTDEGTHVYTNARPRGRRHYFRVQTEETDIGAWRSRVNAVDGEADLYWSRTTLPSTASYFRRSIHVGADGGVLNPTEFAPGQLWTLLVYADPGKPWTFVSGRAYVQDLGTLQWTDSDSSGTYNIGEAVIPSITGPTAIGGEGMRFYKSTVPAGVPAVSLWLHGSDKDIAVRKSVVPFHTSTTLYDRKQTGQMLLVPDYLASSQTAYFMSVTGKPGDLVNFDSRIQEVNDLEFNSEAVNVDVPGAPYRVYRVQVPLNEIAWDVSTVALDGNPNIAVRRSMVPAEFENEAFSEVGGSVTDTITLVPPFLSDGTWFITVYGNSPYRFTLRNGPPELTPINYTDMKINDQPGRTGWRFYALTNVPAQIGTLGWELELANHVPGTQIALRRNSVPSRWRDRINGQPAITQNAALDFSSSGGFLQRPAHQADIWYVGVYMPTEALGPFVLNVRPIEPPQADFDGTAQVIENLEPGRMAFVRVEVPAGARGWDVRVDHPAGFDPTIAVRRNLLPELTQNRLQDLGGWTPTNALLWPTGFQWSGGIDWTGFTLDGEGHTAPQRLVMGMGQPLEPGTYFVAVFNGGADTIPTCTVRSQGIGAGLTHTVTELDYDGGSAAIANLPPREARYFKVTIPPNSPSWELVLDTAIGDAGLVIREGTIPDCDASLSGNTYRHLNASAEVEMVKVGQERYVLLPASGTTTIPAATYFIAVTGEGVGASGQTIGTGTTTATLTSLGPLEIVDLGTAGDTEIVHPVSLVAGQVKAYEFQVPAETQSLELRFADRVGSSAMVVLPGEFLAAPSGSYGADGGTTGANITASSGTTLILTASNPVEGRWNITLNAGTSSGATGTLLIKALGVTPVAFDGGTATVTDHQPGTVRYFSVQVPEGAQGWDVRMSNFTGTTVPIMVVRRDLLAGPPEGVTPGWNYHTFTAWPSGHQTRAGTDWTGRSLNPDGPVLPRLVTGRNRPLEPGKYSIGVFNGGTNSVLQYQIRSFGIGTGLTYAVTPLAYDGGTAQIDSLAPREARYFRVDVPAGSAGWEVVLTPSAGELQLLAREGAIPDFNASTSGNVYSQVPFGCEVEMQKTGQDRYVLLPLLGEDTIPAGSYYLAVAGMGANSTASTIGTGPSDGTILSRPLAVKNLGVANSTGTTEAVTLLGAQMKAYRFTVPPATDSLEVRLDNVVGNAWVSLVQGTQLPTPPGVPIPGVPTIGTAPHNEYGTDGGNRGIASTRILTVANPGEGDWRVIVRAGHGPAPAYTFEDASAELVVTALSTVPIAFDGGTSSVNGQQPGTWRYFAVTVPAGADGWDVRLRDLTGSNPAMLVRRDVLPDVPANLVPQTTSGWTPQNSTTWPSENQWLTPPDWTGYTLDPGGKPVPPRLVTGMGRPLEPGSYFVGLYNNTQEPCSYTIDSRGIGAGMTYPVTNLDFAGGTSAIADLAAREARYFRVSIPGGTPSWELTLDPTVGDLAVLCRAGAVPDFTALREGSVHENGRGMQLKMKKAGPERYVLLPHTNQDLIPEGDYYLAVVSDGLNPTTTTAGTDTCSGAITSRGELVAAQLGNATVEGTTEAVALAGGQVRAYRFDVPPGTESIEIRLQDAVGRPAMSIIPGLRLPVPVNQSPLVSAPHSEYGHDGGTGGTQVAEIHSVSNPAPGTWSILVKARHDAAANFPEASANLVIKSKPSIPLNFAASLNAGGGTHTDRRMATDGEWNIYRVQVPATLDGQPVLGWMIDTAIFQGAMTVEVYKDFAAPNNGISLAAGTSVIVPPFLTFDSTWYVRVKATGTTDYQISSRPVTLERPAWQMPPGHNATFGDTGNDVEGNPLPGDRGIDLANENWHFYAIDIPENNAGILRTELRGISGNPDLYLREDGVPTTSHLSNGRGGTTLAPRALTNATTGYGNWVPLAGRAERRLAPGRWHLGVRAGGGSNARYRLIVSNGAVKDLALNPASATPGMPSSVTEDALADNDWRYYRFTVPLNAPKKWNLTFAQHVGDVVMWLRDTVPPGQAAANSNQSSAILSWRSDNKNQGPYSISGHDLPDTHVFDTPPLRPGAVYYVGIRSNNSATFSLSSDTSGGAVEASQALDFYTGSATTTVPANSSVLYRVAVPPEATRMKYTSTHSNSVAIRIEQGTLPGTSGSQHFSTTGTNTALNQALTATGWPWQTDQTYYIRFVNTAAVEQQIGIVMNGKNAENEDEDNDGLPDAWERLYFNNSLGQTATGDFDNDGVNNATELADGTLPNDRDSAKYTLTVSAKNGAASVDPVQAKYDRGTVVTLSNTPDAGYAFASWGGGPFRGDDFAIRASGTITIPSAGTWTFGVHAADGSRLRVNGVAVITDNSPHDVREAYGQLALAAGTYPIELVAFERTAGESLELYAATGSFTAFDPSFRLVGDVANGGLEVQTEVNGNPEAGFTVRQVEAVSASVSSLSVADTLLAGTTPARREVTGVIDTVNFLTHDASEGRFLENAHFPLTEGIQDAPVSIAMHGNYDIVALNSIPLDAALDTSAIPWTAGGNMPWLGENDAAAFDGVDAAGSGPIDHSQSTTLRTVVQGPGTLTFRWRVSSASGDNLGLFVNGSQITNISGETAWASRTQNIAAGTQVITWTYSKNASGIAGSDRGWVDTVVFTPQ